MIVINEFVREYFEKVKRFAIETGTIDHFNHKLEYLGNYGERETMCKLYQPMSSKDGSDGLDFNMHHSDGTFWWVGGLRYHGYGDLEDRWSVNS